jgi:hypothetical protein
VGLDDDSLAYLRLAQAPEVTDDTEELEAEATAPPPPPVVSELPSSLADSGAPAVVESSASLGHLGVTHQPSNSAELHSGMTEATADLSLGTEGSAQGTYVHFDDEVVDGQDEQEPCVDFNPFLDMPSAPTHTLSPETALSSIVPASRAVPS